MTSTLFVVGTALLVYAALCWRFRRWQIYWDLRTRRLLARAVHAEPPSESIVTYSWWAVFIVLSLTGVFVTLAGVIVAVR